MTKTIALGAFGLTWLLLLAGCVTETVGGSEVKQDPQAALEKRVSRWRGNILAVGDWENAKRNLELAQQY